jgi:hypothetical protein
LLDLLLERCRVGNLKDGDLLFGDLDIGLVVSLEQIFAVAKVVLAGYDGTGRPVDTTRSMCDGFSCLDVLLEP